MSLSRSSLIAILAAVIFAPSALAQSASNAQADVFRIKRDYSPRLYGNVEADKYLPPSRVYVPETPGLDSAVQANDYAGAVSTAAIPTIPPVLPIPTPQAVKGTYVWGQSAAGGYYDCSGKMPGTVMGDQLYKLGGTFVDGTPVPTTPVVCNFRGHVYKPYVVKRMP
jgi:hypothetical protein